MMDIYPNSKYYLFEGIDYHELNRYKNILLNNKKVYVDWYQEKNMIHFSKN
jgi:hypothetical protein